MDGIFEDRGNSLFQAGLSRVGFDSGPGVEC